MLPQAVLFDLDGTLTDPKEGIANCICHALERMGRVPPHPDTLGWCIGPPLRPSLATLLETDDLEEAARCQAFYRERFAEVGLFENRLYEGIPETLEELREGGVRLFLATSKPAVFARRILEHFRIDAFFERAYGSELNGVRENKGELIAHLLAEESLDPSDAAMVGDREHDVYGAHRNGVRCVGVLYGYGEREELVRAGANEICETPRQIAPALARLFG